MSKYADVYQKFLNLSQAVDELTRFPVLTPDQKCLLRYLNNYWVKGEIITVVAAMNIVDNMSTSTVFRNLKKLRTIGYIQLEIDEIDNRVKYIRPTEQTLSYFTEHGKIFLKTAKAYI
jgi:DNA-binding MarR family transcriptional regulator